MRFGQNLKSARINNGLTQIEVAKLLNISRTTYTKWETDSNEPSLASISQLVKLFGVDYNFLFSE